MSGSGTDLAQITVSRPSPDEVARHWNALPNDLEVQRPPADGEQNNERPRSNSSSDNPRHQLVPRPGPGPQGD
eukprot:10852918-Prorocentrum_lima.AAC.1